MQQNQVADNTGDAAAPAGTGSEVELTWWRTIRLWWCVLWRSVLAGMLVGAVLGFFIAFFATLAGASEESISSAVQAISMVAGLLVGIVAFKSAMMKPYSDFRIVLLPRQGR